jgi:excisionase family DNA binding protein
MTEPVAPIAFAQDAATWVSMKVDDSTSHLTTVAAEASVSLRELVGSMPSAGEARVRVSADGDDGGVTLTVPREALALFADLLGHLAMGDGVTVVPAHAELSTFESADVLNVSRPFLIGLLEAGKIPYRMVGTHRRVRLADLMAYKEQDDARREDALAALTQQAQDLGLGY